MKRVDDSPPCEREFVVVARILNPHGVRGELNLLPITDFPERLLDRRTLFLDAGKGIERLTVERMRGGGRKMIVKFAGVNSPEDAGQLRGGYLQVPVAELHPLENGSYYHHQLIGLEVIDDRAGVIGVLDEIIKTPGGELFSVKDETGEKILFPGIAQFVRQVDLERGLMLTTLPDGIVSEPESGSGVSKSP